MLKIGLTGGIGCGKTTVASLFAALGVPVIDADKVSRKIVKPGSEGLEQIIEEFGPSVIDDDGNLDRKKMKTVIFSDSSKKKKLEAILHPLIAEEIQRRLNQLNSSYVIICIPLLIEAKMEFLIDSVLVIDCPVELQFQRVKYRDRLPDDLIDSIIRSQATREQRLAAANEIIDNSGDSAQLADQVKKLHNSYILKSTLNAG